MAASKEASAKKAAPRGRPTKYTEEVAAEICSRLSNGETLRGICRDDHLPDEVTVRQWASQDYKGFYAQYARSRDIGLDAMADELMEISDNGTNDWMERNGAEGNEGYQLNGEHVQRSRLRVDTRKWYLSKLAPKRYGDRQQLEHTSPDGSMTKTVVILPAKNAGD